MAIFLLSRADGWMSKESIGDVSFGRTGLVWLKKGATCSHPTSSVTVEEAQIDAVDIEECVLVKGEERR